MTDSNNHLARLAGLLYLILILSGIINLLYIPSVLIEWEDAAATLENITQSEKLFRWGIISGIISFLAFLLLPLVLYKLLHPVNKTHALLMVLFVVVSIPISFVNMLNKFSVLTAISRAAHPNEVDATAIQSQVMFYLEAYNNGIELSQIFWGLWLFPFGYLVYQSGFLPKLLGVLLMAGCFGYLITFFGGFLYPDFHQTTVSTLVGLPASIGEIGICLWLLVMGVSSLNFKKQATKEVIDK